MKYKKLLVILLTGILYISVHAQQTLFHLQDDIDFKRGMELLEKEKYSTAQKFFSQAYERYKGQKTELGALSQYYSAFCAVRLFNNDAEFQTLQFVRDNPGHQLVNTAYFNLAGYFYARKKWDGAIKYYQHTDASKLDKEQQGEYHFKLGYSYFSKEDYEKAKISFYEIKDGNTKYSAPALYYYSHIHYEQGNSQTALDGFLKLTSDKNFGPVAPYYIVHIYYKQEKYNEIVDFAPGMMQKVTVKRLPEVSRITAEAYSQLGQYKESLPYFQTFLDSADYITKDDKYTAAYAFYKAGSYQVAIGLFGSISSTESKLGQNASYYLADCYIKTNDKQKARMAFQSASSMDYDPVIKQDALFNYALITYELSSDPFNEAIRAFHEFIKLYPESKRIDEAYKYLIQSYLKARNYRLALESLEKADLRSDDLKQAYQKVAFYRGVELFNNLDYTNSLVCFDKSLKYGSYDQNLRLKALYWKGEANYHLGNYDRAISYYQEFKSAPSAQQTEEYAMCDYNIGYSWFGLKNYQNAIESFRKFTSDAPARLDKEKGDAYNRIADCYYAGTDYNSAADYYGRAAESAGADVEYALLQKGINQGLMNRNDQKISTLKSLISSYPASNLADDARFEIAQSYVKMQNSNEAIDNMKRLISDYPQSNLVVGAYLQLALLYYNIDNSNEAIRYYKETIRLFPSSVQSKDALTGLKNIYVDMNKVDEYFTYVKSVGQTAPLVSVNEKDSLVFVSAEKVYMSGDCNSSSKSFERYISSYPQGMYLLNAHFYKADCNYRNKEFDKAAESFNYVLSIPSNQFTEQSLLGLARIESQKGDLKNSAAHYRQLVENYPNPGNKKEALIAVMEAEYTLKNYEAALKAARSALEISKLGPDIERRAHYIAARALHEQDRDALALDEYKKISGEVMSKEGAEAKFRMAEIYYDQKDYKNAEKEILEFSEKTTSHDYWIARSFILWTDIFIASKDYFQANQTIQSIIDYYEKTDDGILNIAKEKKAAIVKLQQAKEEPQPTRAVEIDIE